MLRRFLLAVAVATGLVVGAPAAAQIVYLDNGSFVPHPSNVFESRVDVTRHYVRSGGCGDLSNHPCADPGPPTLAILRTGGIVRNFAAIDAARILVDGAEVLGNLTARDDARLDVVSGSVYQETYVEGDSRTSVRGGTLGELFAGDRAVVEVRGGRIFGGFQGLDESEFLLAGGVVDAVESHDESRFWMTGGTVAGDVWLHSDPRSSFHHISGGVVEWSLWSQHHRGYWTGGQIEGPLMADGHFLVVGTEFAVDGEPVSYKVPGDRGTLTGRLASGETFEVEYRLGEACAPLLDGDDCNGEINLVAPAACSDGIDQDGDGYVDGDDPGCFSPLDPSERSALECDNGIDDDGDGGADYPEDPGCLWPGQSDESPACDDGIDNDGDGHGDLDDPDCTVAWLDDERGGSCRPGPGAAGGLLPLLFLARRAPRKDR